MPCHCFQGDMKIYFYKIFMFLVGKSQEVAACKRAFPSCHQSSSLHPSLLGWNPGPHTCLTSAVPGSSSLQCFSLLSLPSGLGDGCSHSPFSLVSGRGPEWSVALCGLTRESGVRTHTNSFQLQNEQLL